MYIYVYLFKKWRPNNAKYNIINTIFYYYNVIMLYYYIISLILCYYR